MFWHNSHHFQEALPQNVKPTENIIDNKVIHLMFIGPCIIVIAEE